MKATSFGETRFACCYRLLKAFVQWTVHKYRLKHEAKSIFN